MERLRDRMIQELRIRGKAERTVEAYVHDMRLMTERTGLLPGRVTEQDIKAYLEDLREVRQVAPSTFAQHVAAIRFFYTHVVPRLPPISEPQPCPRKPSAGPRPRHCGAIPPCRPAIIYAANSRAPPPDAP